MATVVLAGTLDTKGVEYGFLRERLDESGVETVMVDVGILGEPKTQPDVMREEVARGRGMRTSESWRGPGTGAPRWRRWPGGPARSCGGCTRRGGSTGCWGSAGPAAPRS